MSNRGYSPYNPSPYWGSVIDAVRAMLQDELRDVKPVTVRQIFYRLIAAHDFPKTERDYKALARTLTRARRSYMISFDDLRDDGITERAPLTYTGPDEVLARAKSLLDGEYYMTDLQRWQEARLVLWCEAAGMVPQLARVANQYGVTVISSGGQPSVTFCRDIAIRLRREADEAGNQRAIVLQLGDHDPTGLSIVKTAGADIAAFGEAHAVNVEVVRIGVTEEQINGMSLITAPAKVSDPNIKNFPGVNGDGASTVQLEAIPPVELAAIVKAEILARIDADILHENWDRIEEERLVLQGYARLLEDA